MGVKAVSVFVDDVIYGGLEQFAKDRGLDVLEGVKWLLGDFVYHNVATWPISFSPVAALGPSDLDKMMGLARVFLSGYIIQHNIRCPACGAPATVAGLEKNECEKCQAKLI